MLQHWGRGEGCAGERGWINCSIIPSICRHRLCCSKHCSNVKYRDGLCHGELEFTMKQLLRESSVVSNSGISSLLRLFVFYPWEMLWSSVDFVCRGRFRWGSCGRFIPVLVSNKVVSNWGGEMSHLLNK